ncbi:MAG: phosphoribosylformylglycinamidine cyclo-ligase [Omnitrophica bacterium RIFCSPLOWO2_12_FULL_50_11]|nr:MAG: phosphoribosylformylglycinamidine cyclo-ligase [Omnitrophica bacterium RIFCSPLOWO2_12_FULL_50_11]
MVAIESYAGVPHLKGDRSFNQALAKLARSTEIATQVHFGGYSALFDMKQLKLRDPLLVATTDGVGTKLDVAKLVGKHDTIGIDLVAMSVNDLITCGAKPLFFLDYIASGAFDRKRTMEVLRGIARGCRESGCALGGGETAIMPGFYGDSTYDLAGFAIGVVERSNMVNGKRVRAGHVLLGLASSGFHANGFSLIRKVFTKTELSGTIGRKFLTPTCIYVKPVLDVIQHVGVDAIAHITGGAFYDNLPRILPKGLGSEVMRGSWPIAPLFSEVRRRARYPEHKMYHTFNMGIGMILVLRRSQVNRAQLILKGHRIDSWEIGVVRKGSGIDFK